MDHGNPSVEINNQHHCQSAKTLLNSAAVKPSRHLNSKDVSLKVFNDTQPYLNENALLNWTATITAIFTENKMTWVCSARAFSILRYSIKYISHINHNSCQFYQTPFIYQLLCILSASQVPSGKAVTKTVMYLLTILSLNIFWAKTMCKSFL